MTGCWPGEIGMEKETRRNGSEAEICKSREGERNRQHLGYREKGKDQPCRGALKQSCSYGRRENHPGDLYAKSLTSIQKRRKSERKELNQNSGKELKFFGKIKEKEEEKTSQQQTKKGTKGPFMGRSCCICVGEKKEPTGREYQRSTSSKRFPSFIRRDLNFGMSAWCGKGGGKK